MDTYIKTCKKCEREFDSIPAIDGCVCDECRDEVELYTIVYTNKTKKWEYYNISAKSKDNAIEIFKGIIKKSFEDVYKKAMGDTFDQDVCDNMFDINNDIIIIDCNKV